MPPMHGRSREGAWIEIGLCWQKSTAEQSRSRKGAWIEISWS